MKSVRFNPKEGYPLGKDLFYRCNLCGDMLPSLPGENCGCRCRNIMIDIDYGRISVKYEQEVELLTFDES